MQPSLLLINWSGKVSNAMEQMIFLQAACKMLRSNFAGEKVYFSHPTCDGMLTRKGPGILGSYRGTVFHVQLDSFGGTPRSVEFLLPKYAESYNYSEAQFSLSIISNETSEGIEYFADEVQTDDLAEVHSLQ